MPFWLHEHKIMFVCKGQPLRYKIATTGIVLGVLGLGWFIGIFTPWQWELDKQQRAYAVILDQKKIFESTVLQYHCCSEQCNQLKNKHQALSKTRSLQHMTSTILAFMHKNNIVCGGIERGQTIDKGSCQRNDLTFVCKGAYHSFLSFLKMVDESKQPFECRSLTFHKKRNRLLVCHLQVRIMSAKEEVA